MQVDPARVAKGMWWDRALSLVEGCTPCSPECKHCWSAAQTHMRQHRKNAKTRARYCGLTTDAGQFNGTVRFMEDDLVKPLRTREPTVWAVWNDLGHPGITDEQIARTLAVCVSPRASHHNFLLLSKRIARMTRLLQNERFARLVVDCLVAIEKDSYIDHVFDCWREKDALLSANVGLGTTVGHPDSIGRIDELLKCPAAMRFVSCEPLLAELNLAQVPKPSGDVTNYFYGWTEAKARGGQRVRGINWLIIGPETGRNRRPCKPEWIESLVDQADSAGLPVFVKAFPLDGRVSKDMAEWPEYARRREFPNWGGE